MLKQKSPYKWYFKRQESVIINYMRKLSKSAPINQMPSSSISRICRKTCSCLELYAWTYCNFLIVKLCKKQCRAYTCMKLLIFNNSLINNDVFGEVNRARVHNGYYFRLLWKINLQRWLWQSQNTIWVRILDNVNFTYIIKIIYIVLHVHVYVVFIFNFR